MTTDPIALADWRRRTAEIYAIARNTASPEAAWHGWRQARDRLFRDHAQSPIARARRDRYTALRYFDYDAAARFVVAFEPIADGRVIEDGQGDDARVALRPVARTSGIAQAYGRELTLYWVEGYGGGLFLPFADATTGGETHANGRYLLDGIKGADLGMDGGRIVIDFNFAFNPSAAYGASGPCPPPPAENRLDAAVRAGEKMPD